MPIQEYLQHLLDLLLFENYQIEVNEDEEQLLLTILLSETDSGILIGRHGETLVALQRIIRTVFAEQFAAKRLIVNVNDYRDQREEKIRIMIDRAIDKIRLSGRRHHLYRLNSSERFFAHHLINTHPDYVDYTSYSIDDPESGRVLVIETKT
jgi:spoIIIJ-associated protein